MTGVTIRLLRPDDAETYAAFRRESLLDTPLAFTASAEDDRASSAAGVGEMLARGPESVIVAAFAPELVGAVGMYREHHVKRGHKMQVWGMYVTPSHRGAGVGLALMQAAVRHAQSIAGVTCIDLSVSSTSGVQRVYERAGFRAWGTEPQALRHNGESVSEHHMSLQLTEGVA